MPSEGISFNQAPASQSLESLKETFKQRLEGILYKQLTPENIETFADKALAETILLNEDILKEYEKNQNFKDKTSTLSKKGKEDEAFKALGLQNIGEILQSIMEVKNKIDALKAYLQTNTEQTEEIITPPTPDLNAGIIEGQGNFKEKETYPRLLTLLYILQHDFNVPPTNVTIIEGSTTKEMVRQTPYVRVEISDLKRVAYICDEEGNASYVFDTEKLKEIGMSLEKLDLEDKEAKKLLITSRPGIGIRIIQTINWRDNVATALGEEMKANSENKRRVREDKEIDTQEIPQVATGEFDPWRGFWADEEGKHWGAIKTLATKFGIGDEKIKRHIEIAGLTSRDIRDIVGHKINAYCYEDLEKEMIDFLTTPEVDKEGEWKGFLTDTDTGKHWGAVRTLSDGLGVRQIKIKKCIEESNFTSREIRDVTGRQTDGYCYEDLEKEMIDFLTTPEVDKEGEWKGFLTDTDTGKHWGATRTLATKLGIDNGKIKKHIKVSDLPSIEVRDVSGRKTDAYCYEDLEKEMIDFLTTPEVDKEGEWKGFLTDTDTGKHWGTIWILRNKLGISYTKIKKHVKENGLSSREIRDIGGRQTDAYCYEDLLENEEMMDFLTTPEVDKEGEWKGFFADPDTGKHWGAIKTLATKFGIDNGKIKGHIEIAGLISREIRDVTRNKTDGYCYEDLKSLFGS
jgi:uncharacterized protein (DUF2147 family)